MEMPDSRGQHYSPGLGLILARAGAFINDSIRESPFFYHAKKILPRNSFLSIRLIVESSIILFKTGIKAISGRYRIKRMRGQLVRNFACRAGQVKILGSAILYDKIIN